MLKAELKIGDLADNIPTVAGQSVSISESYIHPFVHSNVESVLVRSAGQWFFVVRERFQTDGNGQACSAITVISDVPVDRFQQLYQECLNWPSTSFCLKLPTVAVDCECGPASWEVCRSTSL